MTKPSSSSGVLSCTSYSNLLPLIKSTYILSCNARKTSVFLSTLQNPKPAEIHCTYKTSPKLGLDSTFGLGLKFRCFRGTKTSAICQAIPKETTLTPPYKSKIAEIIVHVNVCNWFSSNFQAISWHQHTNSRQQRFTVHVNISETRVEYYIGIRFEVQVLQRNWEFCYFSGNSQATHLTPPYKSKIAEVIVHVNICN